MKTKNLLLLTVLLMLGISFTGCVKDSESAPCYKTGSSSISFTLDGISTRAVNDTQAGYEFATEAEVNVNNFFIGFYDTDGTYITSGIYDNLAKVAADDGKVTYTVSNITVPMEQKLTVYVVANAPLDYKGKSLAELKQTTVSYTAATDFIKDASNLIKVGGANKTFTTTDLEAQVELTQLAAKVRVKLDMDSKVEKDEYTWETNGKSALDVFNTLKNVNGEPSDEIKNAGLQDYIQTCQNNTHGFGVTGVDHQSYINSKGQTIPVQGGNTKWLVIKCDSVKKETVNTWSFNNPSVVVKEIAINSLLEKGNSLQEPKTGNYSPACKDGKIDFIFYTYQKKNEALPMTIIGILNASKVENTYKKTGGQIHGVWVDANDNVVNGWGGGSKILPAQNGVTGFGKDWIFASATPESAGASIPEQSYSVSIQPKNGNFESGHYYEVTGTLKVDPKREVSIDWQVVSMSKVEVDIPPFE